MLKGQALSGRGSKAVLVLALLLGGLAAVLTAVYLGQADKDSGGGGAGVTVPVVVASQDIAAGVRVEAGMVTVKTIPEDVVLPTTFQKVEDVVGKVTRIAVVSGEQIVAGRLVGAGEAGRAVQAESLAEVVPLDKPLTQCSIDRCGQRGLAVSVAKNTASGGLVRAGDRVDVIIAFQDGSALTVLEDVEVLAIDEHLEEVVVNDKSTEGSQDRAVVSGGEGKPEATTATLALWPGETLRVAAAEEFAKGGRLAISDELKNRFNLPNNEISCSGSLRLAVRHVGQQGPTGSEGRGTCASLFSLIWG